MQSALTAKDPKAIVSLFRDGGWWRDMLNIDFDFNTLRKTEIEGHLAKFGVPEILNLHVTKQGDPETGKFVISPTLTWVQAFLEYETAEGRGRGLIRLTESVTGAGDWAAFTFFVRFDSLCLREAELTFR